MPFKRKRGRKRKYKRKRSRKRKFRKRGKRKMRVGNQLEKALTAPLTGAYAHFDFKVGVYPNIRKVKLVTEDTFVLTGATGVFKLLGISPNDTSDPFLSHSVVTPYGVESLNAIYRRYYCYKYVAYFRIRNDGTEILYPILGFFVHEATSTADPTNNNSNTLKERRYPALRMRRSTVENPAPPSNVAVSSGMPRKIADDSGQLGTVAGALVATTGGSPSTLSHLHGFFFRDEQDSSTTIVVDAQTFLCDVKLVQYCFFWDLQELNV